LVLNFRSLSDLKDWKNLSRTRDIWIYCAAGLATCVPFFVVLLWQGSLNAWYTQSIHLAIHFEKIRGNGFSFTKLYENMFHIARLTDTIWVLIPPAAWILTLWAIFRKNPIALVTGAICIASWLQYHPVPCPRHMYWASAPIIGIYVFVLFRVFNLLPISKKFSALIALIAIGSFFAKPIETRLREGYAKITYPYITMSYPAVLVGMKVPQEHNDHFVSEAHRLQTYMAEHPDSAILNEGWDALYLTFVDHNPSFHPLFVLIGEFVFGAYPEYLKEVEVFKEKYHPLIIPRRFDNPVGQLKIKKPKKQGS